MRKFENSTPKIQLKNGQTYFGLYIYLFSTSIFKNLKSAKQFLAHRHVYKVILYVDTFRFMSKFV